MPDLEKVMVALKNCADFVKCRDCPWDECEGIEHDVVNGVPRNLLLGALELLNGPTVSGWVSVKDRLPENKEIVIGYTPCDGYMFVGFYRTYKFDTYEWSEWNIITSMRSTKKITKKVTHWMPLPEPPEVSENG